MEPEQELDKKVDRIELDCGKCPISKEDCLRILEVVKVGEGSYFAGGDCLFKILLRDTIRFFHF